MFAHFNTCHFLDNQGDDDEEHSKSPLFLHLMCSLRNPSSQGQPTTTVSISTLPVCLGEYSVKRHGQASWYCHSSTLFQHDKRVVQVFIDQESTCPLCSTVPIAIYRESDVMSQ